MNALGEYALPLAAYWLTTQLPDDPATTAAVRVATGAVALALAGGHAAVLRAILARGDRTVLCYFPRRVDARGRPVPDTARDPADAVVQTVLEHDVAAWRTAALTHAVYAAAVVAAHVLLRATSPLVLAAATVPYAWAGSPLVAIHLGGRPAEGSERARPFAAPRRAKGFVEALFGSAGGEVAPAAVGAGAGR